MIIKETATPAKISLSALVASATRDTPRTIIVATKAPPKASNGTVSKQRNSPVCSNAKIATNDLIKEYLHPCISYMESKKFSNKEITQMKRIIQDLNLRQNNPNFEKETIEGRRMFYEWIQQYDKRRDLNFLEVFPQMADFYEECKQCMI